MFVLQHYYAQVCINNINKRPSMKHGPAFNNKFSLNKKSIKNKLDV